MALFIKRMLARAIMGGKPTGTVTLPEPEAPGGEDPYSLDLSADGNLMFA